MFRFYTDPPVDYPYLMMKFSDYSPESIENQRFYLVDSGVYELQKFGKYELKKYEILKVISSQVNVEFVIPDYPSDLIGDSEDNIKKTFMNIARFFKRYSHQNLIPVIQSLTADFTSFRESFEHFIDLYPDRWRVGIGNLCLNHSVRFYRKVERYLRPYMKQGYDFHIFGMYLKALPLFKHWKQLSWDGMKWTRSGNLYRRGLNLNCRTQEERVYFFQEYLAQIDEMLKLPALTLLDFINDENLARFYDQHFD